MRLRHRRTIRLLLSISLFVLSLSSVGTVSAQTSGVDLTGQWDWTNVSFQTGSFHGIATIDHDVQAGTFTWTWTGNTTGSIWEGTGTVSGSSFTMTGHEGDVYTAEQQGTILDEDHLEGTWTQSDGQNGTSSAVRISSGADQCPVELRQGWFQPTQGVWQDDNFFNDKPTPKLRALSLTEYRAELPMVVGRLSLLFGVHYPRGGKRVLNRNQIQMYLNTNGTTPVPVKMRFRLNGEEIYTSDVVASPKLDGPCGEQSSEKVVLDSTMGIPPPGRAPFRFNSAGPYELEAELVREDGTPVGPTVTVEGRAVETRGPTVYFTPIVLTNDGAAAGDVVSDATRLADEGSTFWPDYLPVRQSTGFTILRQPVIDLRSSLAADIASWSRWADQIYNSSVTEDVRNKEFTIGEVSRQLALGTLLGRAERAVIVVRREEFPVVRASNPNGFAASNKVVFVASDVNHYTVAHEIAHTMPFLWSSDQMVEECGYNYHNKDEAIANGFQITKGRVENRANKDGSIHLMTPADERWPDQCTYWNLVKKFQAPIDPPVILVQGRLGRNRDAQIGELFPAYQIPDGVADEKARRKGGGKWAVILSDARGRTLARYPFTPQFVIPAHPDYMRKVISFTLRVPQVDGVKTIRLVGPEGRLDKLRYSASAPEVVITSPSSETVVPVDGMVNVTWAASDLDGGELLSTVLYSSDGGTTWKQVLLEEVATQASIELDDADEHMVQVLVTDGARSSSATVEFSTPST